MLEVEATSAVEANRSAELEAGRARFNERVDDKKVSAELIKAADEALKEDEKRRDELVNAEGLGDKAKRERAQAEVGAQAQEQLGAYLHLSDQKEKITTLGQQLAAERLEGPVNPKDAEELVRLMHVGGGVNQPTPLAHEKGFPTEETPLTTSGFETADMSLSVELPSDTAVPKTRHTAAVANQEKIPPVEKMILKENGIGPAPPKESVEVFDSRPDTALSWPVTR